MNQWSTGYRMRVAKVTQPEAVGHVRVDQPTRLGVLLHATCGQTNPLSPEQHSALARRARSEQTICAGMREAALAPG